MATSSLFNRIVYSTEAEAQKLADGLEKAEELAETLEESPIQIHVMGMDEIRRVFGQAHE